MTTDPHQMVAVVTGGAQGIGQAVARALTEQSFHVVAADVDGEALAELPADITGYAVDVADPAQIAVFGQWLAQRYPAVQVLVNNAGIFLPTPLATTPVDIWNTVLDTNLRSCYLMVQALLPLMRQAEAASIVNIASTRALMSEPHSEAYAASKGGMLALTHALALSLADDRIRVNAISPGWISTEAWKKSARRSEPTLTAQDHAQHPSRRVGTPDDVARAVVFLTDPANGFINGTNIIIDGGMTVKMIYAE